MKSIQKQNQLLLFCIAAIIVDFIPGVKLPFLWSETFFHEISHGLMAVATGGSIVSLTLNYDGSGYCVSRGGVSLLIAFFGYFGSALWGLLIYLVADSMKPRFAHSFMVVFLGLLILTMLLWVENLSTYLILGVLIALFSVAIRFSDVVFLKSLIQFIGIFVLLDAIRSPLALIDGQDRGDGAKLADITYIPELVWISVWMLLGLIILFFAYRKSSKC